jgi:hypothetical protein
MNIDKTMLLMWIVWYLYKYGPPPFISYIFYNIYFFLNDTFYNLNYVLFPDFWEEESDSTSDKNILDEQILNEEVTPQKYEDKYLENIRELNKEWILTKEELEQKEKLTEDFYGGSLQTITDDMYEICEQINYFKREIEQDTDTVNYVENCNEYGDNLIEETTLEERNEFRNHQINELNEKLDILKTKSNTEEGLKELKNNAEKQAYDYIINKRKEKLKNCYVIEKTPQGNVLMIYNNSRESFSYYSDATIPYRYLEVVGRKYVKFFGCRPLFVDMEEELKLFEEKWTKEYEMKKVKENEERLKAEEAVKTNKPVEIKKNIFAKFKSYNKDAGGKISMAPPPKNSIPNKPKTENKEDEKIILKERANRYTYEGKFANFNFLQKIERKVFNKKLALSFADFKKMQQK